MTWWSFPVLIYLFHLVFMAPYSPSFPPVSLSSLFSPLCWLLLFSLTSKCCSDLSLFYLFFSVYSRLMISSCLCGFKLSSICQPLPHLYLQASMSSILQACIFSFLLDFSTYVSSTTPLFPFHPQPSLSQFDGSLLLDQALESLWLFSFPHMPHPICRPFGSIFKIYLESESGMEVLSLLCS